MATPIGTLGTIPTLTVGGRVFTDLTTLKTLGGYGAAGSYNAARSVNATAGYTVTGGTTLTIAAMRAWISSAPGTTTLITSIGYCDNDIGLNGSVGTNPVYMYGSISAAALGEGGSIIRDKSMFEYNPNFGVIAGKYFQVQVGFSNTYFQALGYEA